MMNLTDQEFLTLTSYIKKNYGINLEKKRILIEGRLSNMLRERGFETFAKYIDFVFKDTTGNEITILLNKLTTNHTFFMREVEHFDFLKTQILPVWEKVVLDRDIRIWSAGCSSGQEPYTLAMVIDEYFGSQKHLWDTTILATDISMSVLDKAKQGIYSIESLDEVPESWRKKYFTDLKNGTVQVCDKIRKEVVFKPLNLMENFTHKKPFDLISCRNVMIYFDTPTKNSLVERFYRCSKPGGFFFIGHAEIINKENTGYRYLRPAIYQKG